MILKAFFSYAVATSELQLTHFQKIHPKFPVSILTFSITAPLSQSSSGLQIIPAGKEVFQSTVPLLKLYRHSITSMNPFGIMAKTLCGQAEAGRTQSCQQRKGPARWGSRGMTTACRDRGAGHGHRRTAWAAQGTGMGSS